MTATGHAVIGAVIAAKVANPYLAVPLALASHLAADWFPHWDAATNGRKKNGEKLFWHAAADVVLSVVVSFLLLALVFPETSLAYGFLMVFASQFFDWATSPYYFFGVNKAPFTWFYRLQKRFDNPLDKPWGIINQVALLILLVVLAKIL